MVGQGHLAGQQKFIGRNDLPFSNPINGGTTLNIISMKNSTVYKNVSLGQALLSGEGLSQAMRASQPVLNHVGLVIYVTVSTVS